MSLTVIAVMGFCACIGVALVRSRVKKLEDKVDRLEQILAKVCNYLNEEDEDE